VDANHTDVIDVLRKTGWLVHDVSRVPGFCDLVIYHRGRKELRLVEVKDGEKAKLTALQELLRQEGWPITVVRSRDEALAL
jgi:hypothetical protein